MRVLLDACIDPRVAAEIRGHAVATLFELGWHRLKDAEVLLRAAGRFDVFVTADRGFEHQHNRTELSFGIVIVHVRRNKAREYRPLLPELDRAIETVSVGSLVHVPAR